MTLTNTLLLASGLLLFLSILATTLSTRLGLPLLLVFLGIGMLAGEDGPGGIPFDNFQLAFLIGNLSLAIILLDGGLRTRIATFRVALKPAAVLATLGVALTAGMMGTFATWIFDLDWRWGLLLGAIVGSTDSAAVFSLLRFSGVRLNERVGATLEIESGANDPMAIFLVVMLLDLITKPDAVNGSSALWYLVQQFGLGTLAGLMGGHVLGWVLNRLRLAEGLYALLIASGSLFVFAATNELGGSGFLAIYLAGLLIGNNHNRATEHVLRVMDGLAWLAQAGMFLILGLLVTPSNLFDYGFKALAVAVFLIVFARPLGVVLCLAPFRFPKREVAYIAWVGLRGAVPVVLAVFPVIADIEHARLLFDVTFAVVLVSLVVQGTTVPLLARRFSVVVPPQPEALESTSLWISPSQSVELSAFRVTPAALALGQPVCTLRDAHGEALHCAFWVRAGQCHAADSPELLQAGDKVWLLVPPGRMEQYAEFFSRLDEQGPLAPLKFFGEFVIEADSPAAGLATAYDLQLDEAESEGTVADLLVRRLDRLPVEGDRVAIDGIELTVRMMSGKEIVAVGLKLQRGR